MKVLYRPLAELVIRPAMDWVAYARFLRDHFGVQAPLGLDLDEESTRHVQEHPGDGIPMACAKSCYKAWEIGRKSAREYLENIRGSGHGSVLEHANFGVIAVTTRAITHEIVRHRAGFAFSQESQRYCEERNNAFIMPLSIQGNERAEAIWHQTMNSALESYVSQVDLLMARYQSEPEYKEWAKTDLRKKVREAARGALPNDTASVIHMTANVRSWRHFIEMRASAHAEVGIRLLANIIYEKLLIECPILFGDYRKVPLIDGTFELQTNFKKV